MGKWELQLGGVGPSPLIHLTKRHVTPITKRRILQQLHNAFSAADEQTNLLFVLRWYAFSIPHTLLNDSSTVVGQSRASETIPDTFHLFAKLFPICLTTERAIS